MGVRGTDFYVSENPVSRGLELTVLRGVVTIQQLPTAKQGLKGQAPATSSSAAQFAEVKSGETAVLSPTSQVEPSPTSSVPTSSSATAEAARQSHGFSVAKTDLGLLGEIRVASVITPKSSDARVAKDDVSHHIVQLESQAVKMTVADIASADPRTLARIEGARKSGKNLENVEAINDLAVDAVAETAPKGKPRPPLGMDLDANERVNYEKYFKE